MASPIARAVRMSFPSVANSKPDDQHQAGPVLVKKNTAVPVGQLLKLDKDSGLVVVKS